MGQLLSRTSSGRAAPGGAASSSAPMGVSGSVRRRQNPTDTQTHDESRLALGIAVSRQCSQWKNRLRRSESSEPVCGRAARRTCFRQRSRGAAPQVQPVGAPLRTCLSAQQQDHHPHWLRRYVRANPRPTPSAPFSSATAFRPGLPHNRTFRPGQRHHGGILAGQWLAGFLGHGAQFGPWAQRQWVG